MSPLPLDASKLRLLAGVSAAFLAGCGGSEVIVESTFPRPLIDPLPVSMGVVIPDELYNFIYTEDIPDQSLWTIALGDANVAMLEPLFQGMFQQTKDVESLAPDASDGSLDGVIEPKLEKFEFDVPQGERDEFFPPAIVQDMASAIPDAELHLVPRQTHALIFRQPWKVAEIMEAFLHRHA